VFALGREAFNRRAGLLAATIVAVWPSFLLHTIQLFRDPLFIAAMLLLVLVCARLLARNYGWPKNFIVGAIGTATACLLWRLRSEMWK
jgi:asparagine N-glycosylation enzyme membrane subunit Stt3